MGTLHLARTQKYMEGRLFTGRSFRIFVLLLILLILSPNNKTSAMADIGGENIYDLFNDTGDDVFGCTTDIIKDISGQVYSIVRYVGVFLFVVSIIIAAVGIAGVRAEGRERAKKKLAITIAGAVAMFAGIGVIIFAQSIAGGISTGIIRSEYESYLSTATTSTLSHIDYEAIRGAATNPASMGLYPDRGGYYDRSEIRAALNNYGVVRSSLTGGDREKAFAYGEACVLLYSGTHTILDGGPPVRDWTYDSETNIATGRYYIVDFGRSTVTEK